MVRLRRRFVAVLAGVAVAAATPAIWRLTSGGPESYAATVTVATTAKVSGSLGPTYVGLSVESAA